ncbi:MAG: hypothetical protein AAF694_05090 [Bacteroidota bacterium]
MEPLSYSRTTLLKLLRKDSHGIWQSVKSLFHGFGSNEAAKTLFGSGMVTLPGFINEDTCKALNEQLNEIKTQYTDPDGNVVHKIPSISQLIPLIKEIPDHAIQDLLHTVSGKRIERFQNRACFRNADDIQTPYRTGRLSPMVFTAYLLVRDMNEEEAPIALIPKSHRFSFRPYLRWIIHTLRGTHKAALEVIDPSKTLKLTGKKGDLILLNQNTYHTQLTPPTTESLCHLEFEYMVITRLSDLHQAARENWAQITENPFGQAVGLEPS